MSGQKTDITVNMEPVLISIDTTNPEPPVLYPNPASTDMKAVLPDKISGNVNIRIFNQSGMLIRIMTLKSMQGVPVIIDVNRLSAGIIFSSFHK